MDKGGINENDEDVRTVSAAVFAEADIEKVTLLDIREMGEVMLGGIDGTLHMPFSNIWTEIDGVPKDKPVYVLCKTGAVSEEIVEILTDRGYDAYNVEGGYMAYREYLRNRKK